MESVGGEAREDVKCIRNVKKPRNKKAEGARVTNLKRGEGTEDPEFLVQRYESCPDTPFLSTLLTNCHTSFICR